MSAKRVLLADDDASLCRILEVRLRKLGVQPVVAHDAMHALMLAHKDPPNAVVMDITMPAGNGLAAVEMLAADRRLRTVPVIVMSGRGDAATRDRVSALGADFVLKTGDLWDELKPRLCEALGLAAAAR